MFLKSHAKLFLTIFLAQKTRNTPISHGKRAFTKGKVSRVTAPNDSFYRFSPVIMINPSFLSARVWEIHVFIEINEND